MNWKRRLLVGALLAVMPTMAAAGGETEHSVARQWNEAMLDSIRNDFARPVVHARNLFHVSAAMYDAWAVYDDTADTYLTHESHDPPSGMTVQQAREEAISHAAYRVLKARFAVAPGADKIMPMLDQLMIDLGYDPDFKGTIGDSPAAIGNRIAYNMLAFGLTDGANEQQDYANQVYEPVNPPLIPDFPGNPEIKFPNRWQPLSLEFFIDQAGNPVPVDIREFLGAEWGAVVPFALREDDLVLYEGDDGYTYWVYHDPGPPPYLNKDEYYKWGIEMVSMWSSHCDPSDGAFIDISPASFGNAELPEPDAYEQYYDREQGGDWGTGYDVNPVTGEPYEEQVVPRGDYARVLAEFWADGPDSETPPGHWFTILNYVTDQLAPQQKKLNNQGPVLDALEWDIKTYFIMGGAMHDAAITAWGAKGWYDYIRPISSIRYMADQGQASDPDLPNYDPEGIRLIPGFIELVTEETVQKGGKHEHLAGDNNENVGKIALYAWRGPDFIDDSETDTAGVGWILAENWWPYQRPTFVTPPFAGYVSGHSTFSRAAAEIMTFMTGSPYFPGGMGEFPCPEDEFLVFEDGPSVDITLQWATYRDASDQCSLSRIWGGIHPPADDIPGRIMGKALAPDAINLGVKYFNGQITCPGDINGSGSVGITDLLELLANWGPCPEVDDLCHMDLNEDDQVGIADLLQVLGSWGACE